MLIDPRGKVLEVFVRREPKFTPPFPAFTNAIIAAMRQWEYEPSTVPVCMAVTILINWN